VKDLFRGQPGPVSLKINIATQTYYFMNNNQKGLALLFALAVFTTTTLLLLIGKKAKYDEYDRLMW